MNRHNPPTTKDRNLSNFPVIEEFEYYIPIVSAFDSTENDDVLKRIYILDKQGQRRIFTPKC